MFVWQGFAQSLLKRMSQRSTIPGCGVTFEIVSNIPGVSNGKKREGGREREGKKKDLSNLTDFN